MYHNPDFSVLFKNPAELEKHEAGESIFQAGERGSCMYLIKSGEVEIKRGEKLLETVGPSGVFGEMSLVDGSPRSATAIARTDCELLPIDEMRFFLLVEVKPSFALHVIQTLTRRLRTTSESHKYRALANQFILNPITRREENEGNVRQ